MVELTLCEDGVRYHQEDPSRPMTANFLGDLVLARHSQERIAFASQRLKRRAHFIDLSDLLVVRYVNARSQTEILAFHERFGFSFGEDVTLEELTDDRLRHRRALQNALSGDASSFLTKNVEGLKLDAQLVLGGDGPEFQLQARTLGHFLKLEVIVAGWLGLRHHCCPVCSRVFLSGYGTGGRSTAVFCNDACRQADWRQRTSGGK